MQPKTLFTLEIMAIFGTAYDLEAWTTKVGVSVDPRCWLWGWTSE